MQIENAIEKIVERKTPVVIDRAEVTKVSGETCTAKSLNKDITHFKVALNALHQNDEERLLLFPKVGSVVLIGVLKDKKAIIQTSAIDRVSLKIGDTTLELDGEGYRLNGDSFEGIVKAPELKTQVDKNTAILEAIQNAISNWTVIPEDGGAAFKTALASVPGMQRADLSNIQNTTIKHGNNG